MTTGPRPAGVSPTCFGPETHTPKPCDPATIGVDRLYVTWSKFLTTGGSPIYFSYSDDQGRSWSAEKAISGAASFCVFSAANECRFNQASVPTVNPTTGGLYVSFINGNTPDEDQYLMVRSMDGGATFQGPFLVTSVFDLNYPRSGTTRPDCAPRGQQGNRQVLTNNCFRLNSYGNIVVDKRGGAFADDLYVVISDNRFGTAASTNTDIFLFKSIDGGTNWIGPTRVNDDRSVAPPDRDCGRTDGFLPTLAKVTAECLAGANYGNDQWFPWVDISQDGDVNVVFHDRRLDADSTASEWPGSRQRAGNYLAWFWGGVCRVETADSRDCVAPTAGDSGVANQDCQDQATPNLHCQDPGRTPAAGLRPDGVPVQELHRLGLAVQPRLLVPRRHLHGRLREHRHRRWRGGGVLDRRQERPLVRQLGLTGVPVRAQPGVRAVRRLLRAVQREERLGRGGQGERV